MCGTAASAARVSLRVQPVHQRMSLSVAGPNAASQQRSSSACAAATASSSIGPPSQSSVVTQRNCGLIQDPRGRPRTRRPSIAICGSTRAPALCSTTHLPEPKRSFFASSGTSAVTSVVIASPRAATAATAAFPARVIHEPGRVETPLSRTKPSSRFRCVAATARVAPAKTTGTSSSGTAQSVRRIASIRTMLRSSYSARSTSAGAMPSLRARIDRKTVTASVACRQTSERATASGSAARAAGSSRWRTTSRARRSATSILCICLFYQRRIVPWQ